MHILLSITQYEVSYYFFSQIVFTFCILNYENNGTTMVVVVMVVVERDKDNDNAVVKTIGKQMKMQTDDGNKYISIEYQTSWVLCFDEKR